MTNTTTLTGRGLVASFWSGLAMYSTQAIRMVIMVAVAAVLAPADFGLFSMAIAATGFFSIFSSLGLNSALIWNRDNTEVAAGTAFCLTVAGATVTTILIFFFAPSLARFFNEPRLTLMLRVLAFEPMAGMFSTVHFIMLRRDLKFRSKYWFSLISSAGGSLVLIVAAYSGMGAWSFVMGSYAAILLGTVYLLFFSGISFPICFDRKMAATLLRFGIVAGLNNYLFFLIFNLDYIVVGKVLNTIQLGYYSFAYKFANIPANYISQAVTGVAFPLFAMVKDNPSKLLKGYLKGTRLLTIAVMPVAVMLILFGPPVMDRLYGMKWRPAYMAFRILCLYGLSEAIIAPVGSVLYAAGKPSYQMWVNIFRVVFVVPLAVIAGTRWGIEGIALVFTGVFLIAAAASLGLIGFLFRVTWTTMLKPIGLTTFACMGGAVMSLFVKSFFALSGWPGIIASLFVFLAVFILIQYAADKELQMTVRNLYKLNFGILLRKIMAN